MSTSTHPAADRSSHASWCRGGARRRADWSPMNVAVMVLGFMFFWPVGLLLLGWIVSGRHVRDLPAALRELWTGLTGNGSIRSGFGPRFASDNVVFNDYQQTQYERIREIKAELGERSRRFAEFREQARRRADQEEFDRFMADAPSATKE